ncbi:helix-turn-helix domain-containing protein [Pseudonocardia sp. CA-107938]|uniref:helix-turn-helix domain-containing protein n=1 Tax=Pseudonocardia sp. CA-107938 TaxID=3240021 RepID=UPI003D89E2E2
MANSPVVAAWELGVRLRQCRDAAGMTTTTAAKGARCTQGYVSDVERGNTRVSLDKLNALLRIYDVEAGEAAELRALREEVLLRGWWQEYSAIFDPVVLRMFGLEHGAVTVRAHQSLLITGLLQTTEYAHALGGGDPIFRSADLQPRMEARMTRQRRLDGEDPLRLSVVMSEGALRQQVGGPEVMRRQLQHLAATIDTHENVDVRIVPFTASRYSALGAGTFHIYEFDSPRLPAVLYQESVSYAELIDRAALVREYSVAWDDGAQVALDREQSLALIRRVETEM